jgi:hypothetical protein
MTDKNKRPEMNRARAIREACIECMNFGVHDVNRCPDRACALWEWRRGPGSPERSDSPLRRSQGGGSTSGRSEAAPATKTVAEPKISTKRDRQGA